MTHHTDWANAAYRMICRRGSLFGKAAVVALLAFALSVGRAQAVGLTYVDGDDGFAGPQNLFPSSAIDSTQSTNGDNLWGFVAAGSGAVRFDSNTENSPELRMHADAPNGSYDVYVAYWSSSVGGQQIRAGVASNPGANAVYNRTTGVNAASAVWMVKPADNTNTATDDNGVSATTQPGNQTGGANGAWTVNPDPFYDHGPGTGGGADYMFVARVNAAGTPVVAAGGAGFDIFVDDGPSIGASIGDDTRFDGLAYVPTGSSIFLTANVNRDTGNITIDNPTIGDFGIVTYSIGSASGSLDSTQWDNITNGTTTITQGGWTISQPTPPPTAVSTTFLTEAGPSANFANTSGVLNLGDNVWRRSPIQDVTISAQLGDGSTVRVNPTYSGAAIVVGDFDLNGVLDKPDFAIMMSNMFVNLAGQTVSQAYSQGDITQNGAINRDDFIAFRDIYCTSVGGCTGSGAGSFAALIGAPGVPEPSAGLLLALGSSCLLWSRRATRTSHAPHFQGFASMLQFRKLMATLALTAVAVLLLFETSAQAQVSPVVNWRHWTSNSADDTAKITNPETNDPIFGNGTAGDVNNYQGYGVTVDGNGDPANVVIGIGETATLTGRLRIFNATPGTIPSGDVRLGIWKSHPQAAAAGVGKNGGWTGYMTVIASGANAQGVPNNGHLEVRNPDDPAFLNGNFISDAGGNAITTVAGPAPTCAAGQTCDPNPLTSDGVNVVFGAPGFQRYFRLASGPATNAANFQFNEDYEFEFKVGRFGTGDLEVSASVRQISLTGDYNEDGRVNLGDYTIWRNNLGTSFVLPNRDTANMGNVSQADYTSWKNRYGERSYSWNIGGGTDFDGLFPLRNPTPPNDTFTSHLTTEFNRVGFLWGGGTGADQVFMNDVQFGKETIETLALQVNLTSGAANIKNTLLDPLTIDYYEISSAARAAWWKLTGPASTGRPTTLPTATAGMPQAEHRISSSPKET